MAAAVAASVPFSIKIAHIYGGETTLGAIDKTYRHSISLASYMHFVSTELFKERLKKLLNNENPKIQTVGSLSLENIENIRLLSVGEFYHKWKIDLNIQSILITVHPETVNHSLNRQHIEEISCAIEALSREYQIIITMPNADTAGLLYRNRFIELSERLDNIKVIENFGTQSYFTCMKYSRLMIGNTSSGIVEAASFNKYVLNLGTRQKGRLSGDNVIHLPFDSKLIVLKTKEYAQTTYEGENIYFKKSSSSIIIKTLKNESTLFL
jgi:GDP/UDP-N,N'-diacetylbacillosamine 2-epimerase (hydrolysing)